MSHPFGNDQDSGYRGPNPNAMSPQRQQAIDEFPFLQGILPGTPSESWLLPANSITYSLTPQQREAIWDAVDHERPLLPLLSEQLGWEPWMVRHVQRHWPAFNEIDGLYAHHAWDLGRLLASWTPETAPSRLAPLRRLCGLFNFDLYNRGLVRVRAFHNLPKRVLSAHERCTLLEILEDGSRFLAGCNEGHIVVNQQTVDFHLSGAALRVSLLDKFPCVDYPSWLPLFASSEYFDVHTKITGAAVFDAYRESLALFETAEDCIYQRAMAAVRRVGQPDFAFIECVFEDSDQSLIGPPGYIGAPWSLP